MSAPTAISPSPPLDHAAIRSIIIGILLAMLLAALDQTIVATAMPTIGRDLGDVVHLSWIVTAYLLTSTAVTPLYGKLSDIHGRRKTMMVAIVMFMAGSFACALSRSMTTLILARGLQGLGGGGLISLAQTIIADVVSPKERARYQGYIASVFVASSIAGPVLGGFFAEHLHWSMIFWINLPLGLLAFRMTDRELRRLPRHEKPHRLDILGAALMVLATIALLLALTWGGAVYPWLSVPIVVLLVLSIGFWILFALRLMSAAEPLLPLSVLLNPVVSRGTIAACFTMGTFIGLTIYVPIYLEVALGFSASSTGLALIPLMVGVIIGATGAGRSMGFLKHYKRPPQIGLAVACAGVLTLAMLPAGLPLLVVETLLSVIGIGVGTVLPVTTVSVQNAVPLHQLGTATGSMNFFRSLGGAIVVAGFGAIVLGGHAGLTLNALSQGSPGLVGTFRWVFAAAGIGLALGLCALLTMEERPLRSGSGTAPAVAE